MVRAQERGVVRAQERGVVRAWERGVVVYMYSHIIRAISTTSHHVNEVPLMTSSVLTPMPPLTLVLVSGTVWRTC